MSLTGYIDFADAIYESIEMLKSTGKTVDSGHWQGVPTRNKPDLQTLEMLNLAWQTDMPHSLPELQDQIKPNLPWADDHFMERVSRVPSNPGAEYQNWPWWNAQSEGATRATDISEPFEFTHTYQERFWPRWAGEIKDFEGRGREYNFGIRYRYGDLDDVVNMLVKNPYTRQAYLPIFFPEDTGAVHGGRIPCTLGYHFMLREGKFHVWYEIRSCDAVRHFHDDLYLAARLAFWVLDELARKQQAFEDDPVWEHVRPGRFTFLAHSFHVHRGDLHHLRT